MAQVELLLPKMGESVAEATIIKWLKKPGDSIEEDEAVLEIATDKVDSEVPSPVNGKLVSYLFNENDVVQVGAVIAMIETESAAGGESPATAPVAENKPEEPQKQEAAEPEAAVLETAPPVPGINLVEQAAEQPVPASSSGRFYSPLVRSIAAEEGISAAELETIPGTGSDGRLTKDDLLAYLNGRITTKSSIHRTTITLTPPPPPEPVRNNQPASSVQPAARTSGGDEIIEMDRMRKLISEHMVMSKQTSPHVTSFVEADVTNIVKWRDKVKGSFEKREGEKITFTPIFIEAVAKAIRDMPMINVSVNGTTIIRKKDINIGMAAALPSGNLIVPVIKNADLLNLTGLTKAVNDLAKRARTSKLQPDEVKDGTFTITNVGTFGNVMGTPIINQPQVAILAIGVIKKKPAVIETADGDMIAIRHMTFLSLSYDHRVVDGALGGSFLRRIADYLEGWDVNREF